MAHEHLSLVAAPMVKQSDLPFRLLVGKYGATLTYTQMLLPVKLLNNQEYLEFHQRDLTLAGELGRPVVVQLCGNEAEAIVNAGRKLQNFCDGIDLNLGCPQEAAYDNHYGAYLLGRKDWPLVEGIVGSMAHSFTVPASAKLRLCQPAASTADLAKRLEACGASWITLHPRTISARRRRHGAADLSQVRRAKQHINIPVVSNGNVRQWEDLQCNLEFTGADGLMVGETLLGNPCLFANIIPDPVDISLEYLDLCRKYPGTAPLTTVQTHVRHIIEFQCGRRSWFPKFCTTLGTSQTLDDVQQLLCVKLMKWSGKCTKPKYTNDDIERDDENKDTEELDLALIG